MDSTERFDIIRLAARYHDTLRRIQTAGQLDAVLRLGRELSDALPKDQAALFGRLVAAREVAGPEAPDGIPQPRTPQPRTPQPRNRRHDDV